MTSIGAALLAALSAALLVFVTNWLALIPWRRRRDSHWSEQARLVYPVFVAARTNFLVVPAILMLSVLLFYPTAVVAGWCAGVGALAGAFLATQPLNHEVFPRISLRGLLRASALGFLFRSFIWVVAVSAMILMPDRFDLSVLAVAMAVFGLWFVWLRGGFIWIGRKTGLFQPAPERLQRLAMNVSVRMNVPFREVLLMRSPMAQAFAMPWGRQLLFTERLLELLPDHEVAAICAHELAHLTESRTVLWTRLAVSLAFLPWIFFIPLENAFGLPAILGLAVITITVPLFFRKLSRKLESRADRLALAGEQSPGVYARALTRLYEDSLVPAIIGKKSMTHPHLYDRILAAGVTPDFPRPAPAKTMAWSGRLFVVLFIIVFAIMVTRLFPVG